jgi:penicillin-binding protein 1A
MTTSKRPPRPGPDRPGPSPTPPGDPVEPEPGDPDVEPSPDPGPDPRPEPGKSPGPKPDPGPERPTAALRAALVAGWTRARATARRVPQLSRQQVAIAVGIVSVLLLVAWSRCGVEGCPDVGVLAAYQHGGGPMLLDRNGKPLSRLTPLARKTVPIASLPAYLPEAFIAVEDKRFRDHDGVDWRRVPGAMLANLRSREISQGFSTITMQLARNVFPERLPFQQRTLRRKALEIRVAGAIENRFTKDEILELYLNHIYFGGGAYGVDAAAQYYFGRSAAKLTLAQAATLAAIPRAPTLYDPRREPERALGRRDLVLTLMEQQGRVDADSAKAARESRLTVLKRPPVARDPDGVAPYFIEEIRKALERRYGSELYHGRMRVQTTLDRDLQVALEEELEKQLRSVERGAFGRFRHPGYQAGQAGAAETSYLQAAGVVVDARTGDVLAMVGGRDHDQSQYDRALLGRRQLGSAFKPFVYAAALQEGWTTVDRLEDEPFTMVMDGGQVYEPHNYDNSYSGDVTVREALVRSLNIPTVRLANSVGTDDVAALAKGAGFHGELSPYPSMALGTVSASPLEVALAYTAFATLGRAVRSPRWVERIEDETGREIFTQAPPETEAVLDPAVAYVINDILEDVVDRGTATAVRRAGFRGVAAGKTGTTSAGRDVWFVGYTPELVGVIWMGLDQPETILSGAAGGQLVSPVWGRMMARYARGRTLPEPWPVPDGVRFLRADPVTGMVLTEGCWLPEAVDEVFLAASVPAAGCPQRWPRGFFDRTFGWLGGWWNGDDDRNERNTRDDRNDRDDDDDDDDDDDRERRREMRRAPSARERPATPTRDRGGFRIRFNDDLSKPRNR